MTLVELIFSKFPFTLLLGLSLILLGYYLFFYLSFKKIYSQKLSFNVQMPFVSIVMCAKNAGQQLRQTIMSILSQGYEDYELIVVDDFSNDDSFKLLSEIKDDKLKIFTSQEDKPGKKAALTTGIKAAKGSILLMTDADCIPATSHWISSMVTTMIEDNRCEIVLGYGPMKKENYWVNKFSRFETSLTAVQYMSYAVAGRPYMGVGRNLMYKKSLWEANNGFENHQHVISGDDDLFIMQAANSNNTKVNLQPEAFVYSESKNNWTDFFKQKSRHSTTSFHYSMFLRATLAAYSGTHILFWVLGIIFVSLGLVPLLIFVGMVIAKWLVQMLLCYRTFQILRTQDLIKWYPVLDILLAIYYMIVAVLLVFRKDEW